MGRIGQHVPYLRRFARALTGSRRLGDDAVTETLRALVDGRLRFATCLGPRIALYRAFFDGWCRLPLPAAAGAHAEDRLLPADRRLQALPTLDRAAFLLTAMDGFDEDEVATITDRPVHEVATLLERVETELAEQLACRVLLVVPDFRTGSELRASMERMGHKVVGQSTRVDTIAAHADILAPDIVVAMGPGAGRIVSRIAASRGLPVVHVSPEPERLLTGSPHEPAFLVRAPADDNALRAVIAQALFFEETIEP